MQQPPTRALAVTPPAYGVWLADSGVLQCRLIARPKDHVRASRPAAAGVPLPTHLRRDMETGFGRGFAAVRVHRASNEASDLGAAAFTRGEHVHFAPGHFAPHTSSGRELVAHELAHVVQQRQGRVRTNHVVANRAVNRSPQLESEADTIARRVAAGQVAPQPTGAEAKAATSQVVQRKVVRVAKDSDVPTGWQHLDSDQNYEYYDDGEPEPMAVDLAPTRELVADMNWDELSEVDESENELDYATKGGVPIYRMNTLRDAPKIKQKFQAAPDATFGVRVAGGGVFRFSGKGTQAWMQTTSANALQQVGGAQALGFQPPRSSTDPKATGPQGSYEHIVSELRKHQPKTIANAIDGRFRGEAYPDRFSDRAQYKLDELCAVLAVAEGIRTDYAWALLVACVRAMQDGLDIESAFYRGKGQIEALHVGASSHSRSGVSGQLMEQNMGRGYNAPHPTQKSMDISARQWKAGLERTTALFERASQQQTPAAMLQQHLQGPMGFGATAIDDVVASSRQPGHNWNCDLVVKFRDGTNAPAIGARVSYQGTNYEVLKITDTRLVFLRRI